MAFRCSLHRIGKPAVPDTELFWGSAGQGKSSVPRKKILNIVTGKALVTRDLSPRETHGEESHKKYYVTMDGLCKFFCKNGETEESVYQVVQSLYKKHFIYFLDKVPFEL